METDLIWCMFSCPSKYLKTLLGGHSTTVQAINATMHDTCSELVTLLDAWLIDWSEGAYMIVTLPA